MDEGKPEQNPFAAPQSGPEAAEMLLGDDQSFRVINKIVLCRSSVDFSDVCWLTGATEGLVGRQTRIARAAPPWLSSTFAIIMIVIVMVVIVMVVYCNDGSRCTNASTLRALKH